MKLSLATIAILLLCHLAYASAEDAVAFPGIDVSSKVTAHYTCKAQRDVTVVYVNAKNGDSFAVLPVDGTPHVFVGVMSGSGVRYANGRLIWWNKGDTGRLIVDGDDSAAPLLDACTTK
jgi:membrane-bound inhibitor of C-type lysozyme